MIDPHVHCRDGNQRHKTTIEEVFRIADEQGVKKIFDMPNTDPPILTAEDVERRLRLVPESRLKDYFLYIGATADPKQLEKVIKCYDDYQWVVGIKLFAGKSVGDLAVIEEEEQKKVYKTLTELGYSGVIAVHCEKEDYINSDLFNPNNPITHSYARPREAEIESVKGQIRFAEEVNFPGILHILHISVPESVELVKKARERGKIKITCGVTPHHIAWNNSMLDKGRYGLLYKMNPPLRDREDVEGLRIQLKNGDIDWIETDHAPHTPKEKFNDPYLSGFPSLYYYREFVNDFLPIDLGIEKELIRKLTFENIYRIFENKLK